jgi:hypothetical protein
VSESKLQIAMVNYFRFKYPKYHLFAIPNGGNRSAITGAILKKEGARAGVADLFLMHGNSQFHGLWIEVKTDKGKQSPNQKQFEIDALKCKYEYKVVRSLEEFIIVVTNYLKIL